MTETKLARENLIALGGETLSKENPEPPVDEESLELLRLQKLAKSSPDLLRKPGILTQAVEKGWERPVAFLLDLGGDAGRAMYDAARTGQLSIMKLLIARGQKPVGEFGAGVLEFAIGSDSMEIVKTLLAAGAPPNGEPSASPYASTPLLKAVYSKNTEAARLLIEKGADVNLMPKEAKIGLTRNSGNTFVGAPLHAAIFTGQPKMIDLLLAHHADVNLAEPRSGITPLWLAAGYSQDNPGLVKRLLDLGADPDIESVDEPSGRDQGWSGYPGRASPLDLAVTNDSIDDVKLLLKARKSPLDSKILFKARGNLETTRLLLDGGAEPNPPKINDQSILESWAVISSRNRGSPHRSDQDPAKILQGMELLIERGSMVNAEWEKAGFPDTDWWLQQRLIRKYSYPRWAAEKSIRIVDLEKDVQFERSAKSSPSEVVLEEWLLHEEMSSLLPLIKNFTEFALIRKTETGMKEVAIIQLDAAEPFPKLEWGDILEKRGVNRAMDPRKSSQQSWSPEVKESLRKRVKSLPVSLDQGTPAGRPRVVPPPEPSFR